MIISRRTFNLGALTSSTLLLADAAQAKPENEPMYGLISQLTTKPGHRDELVQLLAGETKGMPGCLSYVISLDVTQDDAIWITEVWRDSGSHTASLKLPQVQAAMAEGSL